MMTHPGSIKECINEMRSKLSSFLHHPEEQPYRFEFVFFCVNHDIKILYFMCSHIVLKILIV